MYTNKEQSEKLIAAGIERDSCDMVVFAGKSKKEPYKNWKPEPKPNKIDAGKDWMPVWSDDVLFDMLPNIIKDPKNNTKYGLNIMKRNITGIGAFKSVGYFDVETGKPLFFRQNGSIPHKIIHS